MNLTVSDLLKFSHLTFCVDVYHMKPTISYQNFSLLKCFHYTVDPSSTLLL